MLTATTPRPTAALATALLTGWASELDYLDLDAQSEALDRFSACQKAAFLAETEE